MIRVIHLYLLTVQSLFFKKIPVCIKSAQDSERKAGEQRTTFGPPAAENRPAGGGEAGAFGLGCGEGRGQSHPKKVAEEGGEAAEGAECVSRSEHRAQSQAG